MKIGRIFFYISIMVVMSVILGNLFGSIVFFIGAICSLSMFVIAAMSSPSKDMNVYIKRASEEKEREVYVKDELEIELEVENKSGRIRFLEVHDILPPEVEVVEGNNHQLMELEKGETKKLKYRIKCPVTGRVEIGPIRARYKDAFHFFSEELKEEDKFTLLVLPRTEDMDSVEIHPTNTKHWLGDIKSKNIGVGSEFFSIRGYNPGDEIRDINWKATARYLEPYTNEYEGEKSGDVILVVDGYKKGAVGDEKDNTLNASIEIATSLASAVISSRNRVGLIVSGEYLNWVYPGTGKNHYYRILANLTKFEGGGVWGLEGVKWLLEDFFPRKSMIILISPLTVPEFSETIIDLCLKEYDVMIISPNPLKIEKRLLDEYEETAESLYKAERSHTIDKIWKHGGLVVDWDPYEPLEPAIEEVLRFRKR